MQCGCGQRLPLQKKWNAAKDVNVHVHHECRSYFFAHNSPICLYVLFPLGLWCFMSTANWLMRLLGESPFPVASIRARASIAGMEHYFDANWMAVLVWREWTWVVNRSGFEHLIKQLFQDIFRSPLQIPDTNGEVNARKARPQTISSLLQLMFY